MICSTIDCSVEFCMLYWKTALQQSVSCVYGSALHMQYTIIIIIIFLWAFQVDT